MTRPPTPWCLVVPVKRLAAAKTRLGAAVPVRAELALAFALDTVDAALACPAVRAVFAVTDEPLAVPRLAALGARVVADAPDAGLNSALVHGARAAALAHAGCGIGALSADLPALRAAALALALHDAAGHATAFVADSSGVGTTLLLAREVGLFRPQFGPNSAAAHAGAGAVELIRSGLASLQRDVDTEADLDEARTIGLGPRTAAVVARLDRNRLASDGLALPDSDRPDSDRRGRGAQEPVARGE